MILLLYLDPGTGSVLVYAVIGILSSLIFVFKDIFIKLFSFLNQRKIKKIDSNYDIVFHSEGGRYYYCFSPIISSLCKKGVSSVYITPDKNDPAFNDQNKYFKVINPGNELETINYMNFLNADIVVSTTPHLDIYMWKKSKCVKKYIHFFHAPTGIDFYEKYALSFYDVIFSVGSFTKVAQEFLDKKRHLPQKMYYEVGCTYYDTLLNEYNLMSNSRYERRNDRITVLYAPTWGKTRSSFYNNGGGQFIEKLLSSDFNVIFRPHPQFYISHKEDLKSFITRFEKFSNFYVNNDSTPLNCMFFSDILITDFSGVLFDYAYITHKPILLLNVKNAFGGYEAEELVPNDIDFDIKASLKLAHKTTESELDNICDTVRKTIEKNDLSCFISQFKKDNLFNFGSAGEAAADCILEIQSKIKGA